MQCRLTRRNARASGGVMGSPDLARDRVIDPSQGTQWRKTPRLSIDALPFVGRRGDLSLDPKLRARGSSSLLNELWVTIRGCSRSMRGRERFPASPAAAAARPARPFSLGDSARASHRHRRTTVVASGGRGQAAPASVVGPGVWLSGSCYPVRLHRRYVRLREGCHGLRAHEFLLREGEVALQRVRTSRARGRSAKALPSRSQKSERSWVRPRVGSVIAEILGTTIWLRESRAFLFVLRARRARPREDGGLVGRNLGGLESAR